VTSFIASLSDRQSANFHRFLSPGEFGRIFGPPLSEVAAVDAALRAVGLHPGVAASDRLSIPVTAPASALERAFHVSLVLDRLPGGRVAFTNSSPPSISASVSPEIEGIVGLSDIAEANGAPDRRAGLHEVRFAARPASRRAIAGPTACSQLNALGDDYGAYTANKLAAHYDIASLYALGDFGQGVHIAVVEFETEPTIATDLADYQDCYGTDATVNYVRVHGGSSTYAGDPQGGEMALDIEDIVGLAPDATLDVYQAPNSDVGEEDLYEDIVDSDTDQVVTTSWGECELDSDQALLSAEQSYFGQAATQGQTVLAAAGDDGSTDCLPDGPPNESLLSVNDPASQPYVVGVGGTSISGIKDTNSDTEWNDSSGAGGGGLSSEWCMPSYQDAPAIPGVIGTYSDYDPTGCGSANPYVREVPDVSADADLETGYMIIDAGYLEPIGGTSAAAPLWAAVAALIDSSPFCAAYGSGDPGVLPQGLYTIAAEGASFYDLAFEDITTGTNDYTPSDYVGGLYPATTGYNMDGGLGSPTLSDPASNYFPGLAAQMCYVYRTTGTKTAITIVSPNIGPSAHAQRVVISGYGFLPIPGADRLYLNSNLVSVSCSTTRRCTAVLPASRAGKYALFMDVEDRAFSSRTAPLHFRFVSAPVVTKANPTAGPKSGGNRVTIRGANFLGRVTVHFGKVLATGVELISATEISAKAPAGKGTVYVVVTDVGGTSRETAQDEYHY
jgi:subtilase family serine protease